MLLHRDRLVQAAMSRQKSSNSSGVTLMEHQVVYVGPCLTGKLKMPGRRGRRVR